MSKNKLTKEKLIEEESSINEISEKKSDVKELSISKTVLKTGLLTALVFLLVLVFAFTLAAFISPKFVSDLSLKVGAKNLSAKFSIAQYERTKDINDLATAIERSVSVKKYKEIAKYSEKLVAFKNPKGENVFEDFAEFKDKSLNAYYKEADLDMVSDYSNFIYGNYVYSLYKIKKEAAAYEIAVENTIDYTANNPLHKFINAYIEDNRRSDNSELFIKLETRYDELKIDIDELVYIDDQIKTCGLNICFDLVRLYETFENDEAKIWEEKFEKLYTSLKS